MAHRKYSFAILAVHCFCLILFAFETLKVKSLWKHFDKHGLALTFQFRTAFGAEHPWVALLLDARHIIVYLWIILLLMTSVAVISEVGKFRLRIAKITCASIVCITTITVVVVEAGLSAFDNLAPPVTEYLGERGPD
jgi:hypothetical protein